MGFLIAWWDIEYKSWLIQGWRMKTVNVVLVCRVREAWNVGKRHCFCYCTGKRFGSMVLAMSHDWWREAPIERRRKPKKLGGSDRLSSLRYGTVAAIPLSPQYLSTKKHANMDNDLRDGQWASNYDNPVFLTSDSADPVSPAAEQADQPSGGQALPLLQLSG